MIKCIGYGEEDNGWYVQTACGEEHYGQDCDCLICGEGLTKEDALNMADELAGRYRVHIEKW